MFIANVNDLVNNLILQKTCKIKQSVWNHLQFTEENPRNSRSHVVGDLTSFLTLKKTYPFLPVFRSWQYHFHHLAPWQGRRHASSRYFQPQLESTAGKPGSKKSRHIFRNTGESYRWETGGTTQPKTHPKKFPRFVVNPSSKLVVNWCCLPVTPDQGTL